MPYAWQTDEGPQRLTVRELAELYPAYSRAFITAALRSGASCLADLRAHDARTMNRKPGGKGVGIHITPSGHWRCKVQQRVPWHREGLV